MKAREEMPLLRCALGPTGRPFGDGLHSVTASGTDGRKAVITRNWDMAGSTLKKPIHGRKMGVGAIDKLASWCWLLGIYLGVATTLCWLGLFVFKLLGLIQTNLIISILNLMLNATVLLVIVAVVISIFWIFWSSNMYRVDIRSISGEEIGLHCDSKDEAQTIGKAINDAIFENFALKNTFIRSSWL